MTERAGLTRTGWASGVTVGDYDKMVSTTCSSPLRSQCVYHNNGDGTFTDVPRKRGFAATPYATVRGALGDYDRTAPRFFSSPLPQHDT